MILLVTVIVAIRIFLVRVLLVVILLVTIIVVVVLVIIVVFFITVFVLMFVVRVIFFFLVFLLMVVVRFVLLVARHHFIHHRHVRRLHIGTGVNGSHDTSEENHGLHFDNRLLNTSTTWKTTSY